jgi:hypothetical protein
MQVWAELSRKFVHAKSYALKIPKLSFSELPKRGTVRRRTLQEHRNPGHIKGEAEKKQQTSYELSKFSRQG